MKTKKHLLSILIILIILISGKVLNANEKGIKFFKGTFAEVMAEAKKQNKKIFLDFYTKWCGPCKFMDENVFPLTKVGSFYNEHFISYKVDAEVGAGVELAKKYKVTGYPTYIFTTETGDQIYRGSSIGASDEEGFIRLGKMALGIENKTWEWYQTEYKKGTRSPEFMKGYIEARLEAIHKYPDDKLLWELLQSYPKNERLLGDNLSLTFWNAVPGNKFYDLLLQNKEKFTQLDTTKIMVNWISNKLIRAKWMDTIPSLDIVFEALKKDFPNNFDQAHEFYKIDNLRMEGKNDEFVDQIFKYKDKYGVPNGLQFRLGYTSLGAKNLKPEHAKYIQQYYLEGSSAEPPHFFSVSAYAYLLYKAGETQKAKDFALKFQKLTETYAGNKKMKWSYETMKKIESGETPSPMEN